MGDAVVCVKCNYSKYPEALSWRDQYRKIIRNDSSYKHRRSYPFVIKMGTIDPQADWTEFTHYFDHEGRLRPRQDLTPLELETIVNNIYG